MNNKAIIGALVVVVLLVLGYMVMTKPDQRGPAEKVGDAIGKLDEGVDDAGRELESRTPAERLKDDVKDATDGSPD
jgi:hypothetical protein